MRDLGFSLSRAALQRASRRYHRLFRPGTWWLWGYTWSKFRLDPAYLQIADLIPPGTHTLDLGSGLAMLPALLAELGEGRSALGLEWDEAKVCAGRRALAHLPAADLRSGDIRTIELPACDAVVIQDVLHYFPPDTQDRILDRAYRALRPGGRLILRETESGQGGGRALTRRLEWLAIRCGWNRGPELHYRSRLEWERALLAQGLESVKAVDSSLVTPGNVLMHGTKPQEQA